MTDSKTDFSQKQFLNVIDRDAAERRFHEELLLHPLGTELVPLSEALGRIVAVDVFSPVDVPSFDRSNYDGFAVCAADTFKATEHQPRKVTLLDEIVPTAKVPQSEVKPGTALSIATGAMLPRGADAVVMIEHTADADGVLTIFKSINAGFGVTFAGVDLAAGEIVLRKGDRLTSRETGLLAAIGVAEVEVFRKPKIAIISTGDEIISPGEPMTPPMVYDSNLQILSDAVRELGATAIPMGIVNDDCEKLRERVNEALQTADLVLLSGGTSKGEGDLSYQVVEELQNPGVVVHGVALKPGKPICLAVENQKPVVILPGFPTSAIFTFHEFVAPVIQIFGGCSIKTQETISAKMAVKVNSEIGRTEYLLVGLVQREDSANGEKQLAAYPMGKGSGSVTTFSRADGFVTINRHVEMIEADSNVQVQLLGQNLQIADLIVIGSHCLGMDYLLNQLSEQGYHTKFLAVGSTGGLHAATRGECDLAGIHLLDPDTNTYNLPFITEQLHLQKGYHRSQGILFRRGDSRFEGKTAEQLIENILDDPNCIMVNRNQGSGTRILIDRLLAGAKPAGYSIQAKSHHAVAAAIRQKRADWGVAIRGVAQDEPLQFLEIEDEQYDFAIPKSRLNRPAVRAFLDLLANPEIQQQLDTLAVRF